MTSKTTPLQELHLHITQNPSEVKILEDLQSKVHQNFQLHRPVLEVSDYKPISREIADRMYLVLLDELFNAIGQDRALHLISRLIHCRATTKLDLN